MIDFAALGVGALVVIWALSVSLLVFWSARALWRMYREEWEERHSRRPENPSDLDGPPPWHRGR